MLHQKGGVCGGLCFCLCKLVRWGLVDRVYDRQKLQKLRIQIYMDLRYIDPQAKVLNYFYK